MARAAAHVEDLHLGEGGAVRPRGQLEALERVPALGPRRGGSGDEHGAGLRSAVPGDLARVVAWIALLLVRRLVLLVDDHQPEVGHGREDRRARADGDPRDPVANAAPLVAALSGGELRVQQGHPVAEARPEAGERLRGQRDLGDQRDHAPPPLERGLGARQVDLRLARAGDAMEQELAGACGRWRRRSPRSPPAARVGFDPAGGRAHRGRLGTTPHDRPRAARPAPWPPAGAGPRGRRQARGGDLLSGEVERLQHGLLAAPSRTAPSRAAPPAGVISARSSSLGAGARPADGAGRQHQLQPAGRRRAVLAGDPEAEPGELGRDPGASGPRPAPRGVGGSSSLASATLDHHPEEPPRPERHAQEAADRNVREPLGQRVVERPAQRTGGRQRLDPCNRHARQARSRHGCLRDPGQRNER